MAPSKSRRQVLVAANRCQPLPGVQKAHEAAIGHVPVADECALRPIACYRRRATTRRAVAQVTVRCLAKCRSPIGLMLRYGSYRGPCRDLRAGAHHGAFCLGCCWSLMVLLAAFGVMNLWAMVGLAAVVTAEKLARRGPVFARVVGIASIALAIAVSRVPGLAPGLTGGDMGGIHSA
ncbi:DUF2182 domain-containing protein [Actinacidiphila oryziradicis]|uniref:DUF2182 domain-containing protein n=1 Tax=Actinacidiphila oryziradicis TaxID=2571141 RepID=UPI0023F31A77|nr:DUF2182 domain-containing protein [Actinacidiphila oryziradicis]MCW2874295.1 hypothetical protein [Actinacidiphila oryziradicis]